MLLAPRPQLHRSPFFTSTTCSFAVSQSQRATRGALPRLDDYICSVQPLYRRLVETRSGKGAGALLLSVLAPVLLRQTYVATSPNTRSALLGIAAPVAVHAVAKLVGLGFSLCAVGILLVTLGSIAQFKSGGPEAIPLVPTPAAGVYWSNLAVVIVGFAAGSQAYLDPLSTLWPLANTVYLFSPIVIAILLASASLTAPRRASTANEARRQLLEYSAEEVSYTYERTWSYYRKAGLASASLYWYGLSRLFKGIYYYDEDIVRDTPTFYVLSNFALASLYLFLVIIVERTTLRPMNPAAPHPLTGESQPQLRVDCLRAISLAPAGNPSLEQRRGLLAPVLAAVLGGPGLAASLWWSGGEEEAGWFARRAWRETSATVLSKKRDEAAQ